MSSDVLRKVIQEPAKPPRVKQLVPDQMEPVKNISPEEVAAYFLQLTQEQRTKLIIDAIIQAKYGRRF